MKTIVSVTGNIDDRLIAELRNLQRPLKVELVRLLQLALNIFTLCIGGDDKPFLFPF